VKELTDQAVDPLVVDGRVFAFAGIRPEETGILILPAENYLAVEACDVAFVCHPPMLLHLRSYCMG